jgi:cell wall-associated NlpC family hydrolase
LSGLWVSAGPVLPNYFAMPMMRSGLFCALVRTLAALFAALAAVAVVIGGSAAPAGAVTRTSGVASPVETSFWLATPSGKVFSFGSASSHGSVKGVLNKPIVGMAPTPDGDGYWLVASDGGIFSFGDAKFHGSTGAMRLNQPIVGMAPTPDGGGYWLVASDGGIFSFGDAKFHGSTGAMKLNMPVVGMSATPDGEGYWLVASDGGIFSFGDAKFHGSTGAMKLNKPVVGMAPAPDGEGYWLVASDGGIFNFGTAKFSGSTGSMPTGDPAEKVVPSSSDDGYWVVDQNGTAHPFGSAKGAPAVQALLYSNVTAGDRVVLFAFAQLGKPYIWGGNGPVGYDCSGLALASWQHGAGIGFARVANEQYLTAGKPVALVDLQAGDLVFWGTSQSEPMSVYHTAIYVGGGQIVEATGADVQLSPLGQWGDGDLMPHGIQP